MLYDTKEILEAIVSHTDSYLILVSEERLILDYNALVEKSFSWEKQKILNTDPIVCFQESSLGFPYHLLKKYLEKKRKTVQTIQCSLNLAENSQKFEWKFLPLTLKEHKKKIIILIGRVMPDYWDMAKQPTNIAAYLDTIINNIPHYVFWKDKNSILLGGNKAFAKIAGFDDPSKVVGKTDKELPWTKKQTKAFLIDDQEVIKSGIPKFNIEEQQTIADGSERTLLTSKVPLLDDNSKVIGLLGIYSDITEIRKREIELRLAKEKAELASLAKSEFVAMVSHELRTPLNGILGLFDLLLKYPEKTIQEQEDLLQDMKNSSVILLNLVNDILDFAKLEAGKFDFIPAPFNLREVIEETTNNMSILAKRKGLEIVVDYNANTPQHVIADSRRVRQILFNLVGNAIKFTETGSILVSVKCQETKEGKAKLKISVKDTGIGIPKEKLNFIFEKFNQVIPGFRSAENRGTGLGLSIVQLLVENFSGSIVVKSKLGQGSTFSFTLSLPLQEKNEENRIDEKISPNLEILIVDDNFVRAKIMQEQLALKNISVIESAHAIKKISDSIQKNEAYNVIIIDDQILENLTEDFILDIKKLTKKHKSRIILSTKPILNSEKERLTNMGFSGILVKPIQTSELINCIYHACHSKT